MTKRSVRVRVPASTSNLGPGFDCLGLALGLYNELRLEVQPGRGEPAVEISGEGEKTLPRDGRNLIVRAALTVLADRVEGRLVFRAENRIPLARGLGSSAAAIVAGLYAANSFLPSPLSRSELFRYALTLEGHPDNVAAAIQGGLVLSLKEHKDTRAYPLKAHKDLTAVLCVPDFELPTEEARAVLPHTVLRDQAVANISRTALLVAALEQGRWEWLGRSMEDEIHQPYRSPLVKGLRDVISAARAEGPCGAALSGAGPSVLALCRKGAHAAGIGEAMRAAFKSHDVESRFLVLPVDRKGVCAR